MELDVHVYHHFDTPPSGDGGSGDPAVAAALDAINGKLDQIIVQVNAIGAAMSAQSDAIAAMQQRLNEDWTHAQDVINQLNQQNQDLTQQVADLSQQLTDAMANDAADAALISETQAQLDAANAENQRLQQEAQQAVDEINNIDLDTNFPVPQPPTDTTPPDQAPPTDQTPPDQAPPDQPPPDQPPPDQPPPDQVPPDQPPTDTGTGDTGDTGTPPDTGATTPPDNPPPDQGTDVPVDPATGQPVPPQ